MFDYTIVGAGLFGAVCARELTNKGKKVLVVEKRNHIGGNCYTEIQDGIIVHKYGPHIFHTNNKEVWDYVNKYTEFNNFINSPIAKYKGKVYSLPFNMYTFNELWGVSTPQAAKEIIEYQAGEVTNTDNLREYAISMVGTDIYEKLIEGYTSKQWGRACELLPHNIIKRLPLRFTYDNNYYNAKYQGVPVRGYTELIENLLEGSEILLNYEFDKEYILSDKIIYTGPIDEYFDYTLGKLSYRCVKWENETLNMDNYQGNAVVNYTDKETPYTRIIEHKWFNFGKDINGNDVNKTIISREYSSMYISGKEDNIPCYPISDNHNLNLYKQYKKIAEKHHPEIIFAGRLGEYKYYDMDQIIEAALKLVSRL